MTSTNLSYPIGKYKPTENPTREDIRLWIKEISSFPNRLKKEVEELNEDQLDTPYRPGGWTVRQVVHHCADSHMNSFIRLKLALTEENPMIKPYNEALWAELSDSKIMPISPSLQILDTVHKRWVYLLDSLEENQFLNTLFHPESKKQWTILEMLALYAWHGNHHLAHITELKKRMGWA